MAELGNFFVTIGSKLDSKGFEAARDQINKIATVGLAMGATLIAAGVKAVKAAAEQEQATKSLAQAMVQAGTFTKTALEHNISYASSLQKMTTYSDEAIMGVQRLLTNFGLEGKELDSVTKATLDLAAAKKMDLAAAADLVAKSVGSSTNALSRYGVQIEGAAGSTERAQAAVKGISALFGGQASAMANTFAGRVDQIKNAVDDLWEMMGNNLLPIVGLIADTIYKEVLPQFEKFLKQINETGTAVDWLGKTLQTLIKIALGVQGAFDIAGTAAATFALALTGNFRAAKEGWEELKNKITEYGNKIQEASNIETTVRKRAEAQKTAIADQAAKDREAIMEKEAKKHINATEDWIKKGKYLEKDYIEYYQNNLATMSELTIAWIEQKKMMDTAYLTWIKEQEQIKLQEDALALQSKLESIQQFTTAISDVATAYYDLQSQKIQNGLSRDITAENQKYENRKAWILANITDETKRNQMLDALEKGHAATIQNLNNNADQEEKKLKNKMKAYQIGEAIMNTAVGATKALAQGGPFLGPALAAMITAAGLLQVAKIKAQQFAEGALIKSPTLATFAEEGPEIALPLNHPNTTSALAEALAKAGGGGAGSIINVSVPPVTSRQVARQYGELIGNELMKKIKRNRKL